MVMCVRKDHVNYLFMVDVMGMKIILKIGMSAKDFVEVLTKFLQYPLNIYKLILNNLQFFEPINIVK